MFFEPLTTWLTVLLANGIQLVGERGKNKKAEEYLIQKRTEQTKKEFFEEPHRDFDGKIIIENCLQHDRDLKKYGAVKTMEWVQGGKYNLSGDTIEKENRRLEYKMLIQMEEWGCLKEKEKERLEELRNSGETYELY